MAKLPKFSSRGGAWKSRAAGVCHAIARAGAKPEPTYKKMIEQVRASPAVTADETGWKVGGRLSWLWAFATRS